MTRFSVPPALSSLAVRSTVGDLCEAAENEAAHGSTNEKVFPITSILDLYKHGFAKSI